MLIVNRTPHTVTIGGRDGKQVLLYFVTPRGRGMDIVRGGWSKRPKPPERIAPGSRMSFIVTWSNPMNAAGVYQYNVGFDETSSNIVTYRVIRSDTYRRQSRDVQLTTDNLAKWKPR